MRGIKKLEIMKLFQNLKTENLILFKSKQCSKKTCVLEKNWHFDIFYA